MELTAICCDSRLGCYSFCSVDVWFKILDWCLVGFIILINSDRGSNSKLPYGAGNMPTIEFRSTLDSKFKSYYWSSVDRGHISWINLLVKVVETCTN